jgi:hypothetical protein
MTQQAFLRKGRPADTWNFENCYRGRPWTQREAKGPRWPNERCGDLTGAFCRIRATPGGAGARGLPSIQTMPDTEITEECRALIASVFEPPSGRRLPNGNWRTEIDAATWQWLQRLRQQDESISDCIIRIVIVALHKRGLQ